MITFRDLQKDDYILIHKWCKENEFVRKWYFLNKQQHLETIRKKYQKKAENTENWIYKIMQIDGNDVGFIQGYPVDNNGNWTKQVKVYEKTASVDYFIGNLNYIHKGFGKLIVEEFIKQFISPKQFDYVMISPDPENTANCHLCEKMGFKLHKIVNVPLKRSNEREAVYIKSR